MPTSLRAGRSPALAPALAAVLACTVLQACAGAKPAGGQRAATPRANDPELPFWNRGDEFEKARLEAPR